MKKNENQIDKFTTKYAFKKKENKKRANTLKNCIDTDFLHINFLHF